MPNLIGLTLSRISPSKNGAIFWNDVIGVSILLVVWSAPFYWHIKLPSAFRLLSYIKNARPRKHFMAPRWPPSSSFYGGAREKKAKQKNVLHAKETLVSMNASSNFDTDADIGNSLSVKNLSKEEECCCASVSTTSY